MAGLRLFSLTQQLLEFSLRVRSARHEILSANIANADTPGYRPKDIDFDSIMKSATDIDGASQGRRDGWTETVANFPLDLQPAIYEPSSLNGKHGEDRLDGNSVSLDRQIARLTENSLEFEASLALLSRKLAGLRYTIGEGRR
jgi:flagellar basal-body rod protein FlgB